MNTLKSKDEIAKTLKGECEVARAKERYSSIVPSSLHPRNFALHLRSLASSPYMRKFEGRIGLTRNS